ncbi:hypothetical protein HDU97_005904 [Phlyctochytrium planicorne]|nr:hypothetical protein HDU97_005904 [Phlyctochytrium planicorne]
MKISVKTLRGSKWELEMQPTDTIAMLYAKVEELSGIPLEQQSIIHVGRNLSEDGKMLRDSGIYEGSSLFLVLRLRGSGGGLDSIWGKFGSMRTPQSSTIGSSAPKSSTLTTSSLQTSTPPFGQGFTFGGVPFGSTLSSSTTSSPQTSTPAVGQAFTFGGVSSTTSSQKTTIPAVFTFGGVPSTLSSTTASSPQTSTPALGQGLFVSPQTSSATPAQSFASWFSPPTRAENPISIPAEVVLKSMDFFFPGPFGIHDPLSVTQNSPKPHIERIYLSTLSEILAKPLWWEKMNDPEIMEKWKTEIKQPFSGQRMSHTALDSIKDFFQKELDYFSQNRMKVMRSLDGREWRFWGLTPAGALMSDDVIPSALKESFVSLISAATVEARDLGRWHPGSKEMVLDIFHPFNYPVVYGETRFSTVPNAVVGEHALSRLGPNRPNNLDASDKFQLLPSVFKVDKDGKITIKSYINNLNPRRYSKLYCKIAGIFERILPMLEMTCGFYKSATPNRLGNYLYHGTGPIFPPFESLVEKWESLNFDKVDRNIVLRDRDLRVIVKAASIELTPKKPVFDGGSWHLEGADNEAIMMTAIYYYGMENITDSKIEFREAFDEAELEYEQDEHDDVFRIYRVRNDGPAVQECGHISTKPGRVVVFPNSNQHRVPGFKLADPTKTGHRSMLVFFVCDPDKKVPSTLEVPPQQRDWVRDILVPVFESKVPVECVDRIIDHLPGVRGDERDLRFGLELLKERSRQSEKAIDRYPQISLCEH